MGFSGGEMNDATMGNTAEVQILLAEHNFVGVDNE